jgi:hypothetical protein
MSTTELKTYIVDWCRQHEADCVEPEAESGPFKILLQRAGKNRPFIDVYAQVDDKVILQKGMYIGEPAPGSAFIKGPRFLRDGKHLAASLSELT